MEDIIKRVMAEAAKSNVDKRKVGCVIMGENGEIYGVGHNIETLLCSPDLRPDLTEVVHAEIAAIEEVSPAILEYIAEGLCKPTVYISHEPCKHCAHELLSYGFTKIIVVEEFMKFDTDKIRYDLVPPRTIEMMAEVITFGAKKYKPNNWRECKDLARYEGALMRHIQAWRLGEKNDDETGFHHLAHAMTNLAYIMEIENE